MLNPLRTLYGQLAATYGGVVLLAVAISGLYTAVTMREILLDRIAIDLVGEARVLADQLAEPVSRGDRVAVAAQIRRVDEMTTARILVADSGGQVLASSVPPPAYAPGHLAEMESAFGNQDVVLTREHGPDGSELVQVSVPIRSSSGQIIGVVTESYDFDDTRGLLWQLHAQTIAGAIAAGILAAGLGLIFAVIIARPVRLASDAVRDLASRRSSTPSLPAGGPEEIRALSDAVNKLSRELALHDQGRREFASDIAHELHSLTSAMQTATEALAEGAGHSNPALGDRLLAGLVGHAQRLDRLANDLLELARIDSGQLQMAPEDADLTQLVQGISDGWLAEAEARGMALDVHAPDGPLLVRGDPVRLAQAVGNLVENALKYAGAGGRIGLTVRADAQRRGREVIVEDSGPGIPAEVLPRVFDRYFRVEGRGGSGPGGMGLGLAIARSIANGHGGRMHAANASHGGARFILWLPDPSTDGGDAPPVTRTAARPPELP